jgi:hypothetical protein
MGGAPPASVFQLAAESGCAHQNVHYTSGIRDYFGTADPAKAKYAKHGVGNGTGGNKLPDAPTADRPGTEGRSPRWSSGPRSASPSGTPPTR